MVRFYELHMNPIVQMFCSLTYTSLCFWFLASRESHKVQKEMLRQRQAVKPHANLLAEAKKHWSLARQKTLSRAEREKHVAKLLEAVRGKVQDLVFKHDASRVVQTVSEL